jgi:hypothetical protein
MMGWKEYVCPECGDSGPFDVTVSVLATFDETRDGVIITVETRGADAEWDLTTPCQCANCGHSATLQEFRPPPTRRA